MWTDNKIFCEDMEYINVSDFIPWKKLKNKTVLVTGGTGLIGSTLISALLFANDRRALNLHIIAIVRNTTNAAKQFAKQMAVSTALTLIEGSVENLPEMNAQIDYIIHGACPTSSSFFINNPVEIIQTSVIGTMGLLELARKQKSEGFLYLSSMEAYGEVHTEELLKEDMLGYVNPLITRSCYPESKRMCEAICNAYAAEYAVPATGIRLAQTFGPGVAYNDTRVFAMMARCAMNKEDILLQTKGTSRHSYLYTAQAVTAILTVLLKGKAGMVYNAANPDTYCSIYEMGEMVAKELGNGEIAVKIAADGDVSKYPAPSFLNLDVTAIRELGWEPSGGLKRMYERMIFCMA